MSFHSPRPLSYGKLLRSWVPASLCLSSCTSDVFVVSDQTSCKLDSKLSLPYPHSCLCHLCLEGSLPLPPTFLPGPLVILIDSTQTLLPLRSSCHCRTRADSPLIRAPRTPLHLCLHLPALTQTPGSEAVLTHCGHRDMVENKQWPV